MPSGVIIGLLFPNLTILTKPFAETTVILMLTVSIFRLDPKEILIAFSNIRLLFCGTFFILIIIPLLIFLATKLINIPAELKAILVAWGSCPPLVSMPGLALLIGLNGTAALLILLLATLVFTLTLPILLALLTDNSINIDPISISAKLMIIVCLCTLGAQVLRKFLGKQMARRIDPAAGGLIVILMAFFAVTIMGGIHNVWPTEPSRVLTFFLAATLVCILSQLICAIAFCKFDRATSGTIALAGGSRNLALLLPVASGAFYENLWLFLAVIQIPVYFLPIISKPLYRNIYLKKWSPSELLILNLSIIYFSWTSIFCYTVNTSIVACLMQPNCPKMQIGFGIHPLVIRLIFELRKSFESNNTRYFDTAEINQDCR